jgi:hypothetical protein
MTEEKTGSTRFGVNQFIPIVTAAMAVVFIWLGLQKYGFWDAFTGPLPGFFPVIISAAMLIASVLAFVFSFKDANPVWPRENWMAVLGGASIIVATYLIGLIPSAAVYVIVWLRWFEKCSWKTTLVTFVVIMAIVVGCFVLWLGVPFPKGLIYDAIFGY